MSKYKSAKHKLTATPSASSAQPTCAYEQMDAIIAMLGHTDSNGILHSKIHFPSSEQQGLQGLELVFRLAITKAIMQHDVVQFRKAYVAMERILRIDMESYDRLELQFPAEGKSVKVSPSELCLAFKAWPIAVEVFKLSLAHTGLAFRQTIDSPAQLIYRFGSWLIAPDLNSEVAGVTQVANEAVFLFLTELKPFAQAKGMDLKPFIQRIPFLKQFPPLEQIFWTQYAALSN